MRKLIGLLLLVMNNLYAGQLSQLRDIHLPEPIGLWPLAYGWYVLALLSICIIFVSLFLVYCYYRNNSAKRQALRLLADYQQEYETKRDSQQTSSKLSKLLRRVALVYFPRAKVASLQGDDWISFLNQTAADADFISIKNMLIELPYCPQTDVDLNPLFIVSRQWIKQRRGRCIH